MIDMCGLNLARCFDNMKKKLSLCIFIVFFMSLVGNSSAYAKNLYGFNSEENIISMDSKRDGELPKRFRKSTDKIESNFKKFDLKGMSELNISGSAQFTGDNIKLIKEAIPGKKIAVVDLREEPHGFINNLAVSWKSDVDDSDGNLSVKKTMENEKNKLKSIKLNEPVTIKGKKIIPKEVESEKDLVEDLNMTYIRIPVMDHGIPDDEMVDYFINTVKNLPEGTWLHFHCRGGIGRTTTFMIMYDMMKNGKRVGMQDIVDRQVAIGGKNILNIKNKKSQKRAEFIKKFYKYASENKDNFQTSWSSWVKQNN